MAWPAIERFCRWLRPRKELLVGVVGVAVEEMAAVFPGGSIAVKLVGELAKHGVNRLLDQRADIPEIKPAGQPFPPEQLDEINTWLERLTVVYKGLLDQLETLAGNAQDQQTLTELVRRSLREREDLSREFTAHRREVRLMILSLSRVEELLIQVTRKLNEQGHGQQRVAADMGEFKAYLLNLPGFMEYLRLPVEERAAVLQAHDHFLGGRREEGAAVLLASIKRRGVGHKTILQLLGSVYLGQGNPEKAQEYLNAEEVSTPPQRRRAARPSAAGASHGPDFCCVGHSQAVTCLAFSPDSKHVLSGSKDGTVRKWDVASGKEVRPFVPSVKYPRGVKTRQDGVLAVTYSRNSREVLAAVEAGVILAWDAENGQVIRRVGEDIRKHYYQSIIPAEREADEFPATFDKAVFSADGHFALIETGDWSHSGHEVHREEGPRPSIMLEGSFDAHELIFLDLEHPDDPRYTEYPWNCISLDEAGGVYTLRHLYISIAPTGDCIAYSREEGDEPHDVLGVELLPFHPRYHYINQQVHHWDWEPENRIQSMSFSPDGGHLLLGQQNGCLWLQPIHFKKLKQAPPPSFLGHKGTVRAVAFNPTGRRAVSGGEDGTVRVWCVETGNPLACYEGHTAPVTSVACSPNGCWVASGSNDGTVRLWRFPA